MQITASRDTSTDERRLTITYSREHDDPSGHLAVLILSGRLEHLLCQLGRYPQDTPTDLKELLADLAAIRDAFDTLGPRRTALLEAGRRDFDHPWRDLAREAGVPPTTAVRWVNGTPTTTEHTPAGEY